MKPQFSIAVLLMLMLIVAILASMAHWLGVLVIVLCYYIAPALIGTCLGLMQWPSKRMQVVIFQRLLLAILVTSLPAVCTLDFLTGGTGLGLVVIHLILTSIFWSVQYTVVVSSME